MPLVRQPGPKLAKPAEASALMCFAAVPFHAKLWLRSRKATVWLPAPRQFRNTASPRNAATREVYE